MTDLSAATMEPQDSRSKSERRVGLLAEGFMQWTGGIDFLRMVSDSLRIVENDNVELVLLVKKASNLAAFRQVVGPWQRWLRRLYGGWTWTALERALIDGRERSFSSQVDRVRDSLGTSIAVEMFDHDRELADIAHAHRLDCLLPSFRALSDCVTVPWIGYIFDFQHRHLPDFFAAGERTRRDRQFADMACGTDYVIVNSIDTRRDCLRYLGNHRARFVALPFGASPKPDWLEDGGAIRQKYDLPPRYFIVSNQFWVHKNHKVVFEALKQLRDSQRFPDVGLVCTGSLSDPRAPSYYPSLLEFVASNDLSKQVRILGLIPKRDQIEIMKSAIGVVQPTLFEGGPGGGSVYDAISLGIPAIVSDIPINRELKREATPLQFFGPRDANALAECMQRLAADCPVRPTKSELFALGQARAMRVGNVLRATIESAIRRRTQRDRSS